VDIEFRSKSCDFLSRDWLDCQSPPGIVCLGSLKHLRLWGGTHCAWE